VTEESSDVDVSVAQFRRRRPTRRVRRRRAVLALVLLVAAGVGLWLVTRGGDDDGSSATASPTSLAPTTTSSSSPPTSAAPSTAAPTTVPRADELTRTLRGGTTGDDVAMVQRRLNELGFLVGEPDGRFGVQTEQAVWAYKKLVGLVDPVVLATDETASDVTPELWAAVRDADTVEPRREINDTHVEIYLPQQVLGVFERGTPIAFAHLSSGDGASWCDEITYDTDVSGAPLSEPVTARECGVGRTPGGVFEVTSALEGVRRTPIGEMRDPVFFNHTIAIHGVAGVPLARSMRGGVGVSAFVAAVLSDVLTPGIDVLVWGEDGREPEAYSAADSLPTFNSLDPGCTIGLYTLREGDTRALVAAKFDITEMELNGANVATDGYLEFLPGLEIIIPPADCTPAPTSTG